MYCKNVHFALFHVDSLFTERLSGCLSSLAAPSNSSVAARTSFIRRCSASTESDECLDSFLVLNPTT